MPTVPPMLTLSQAKDWIGIDSGDTRFDSKITTLIGAVSAKIAQYCDTDFAQHILLTSAPEILDGGRVDIIIPTYLPIISVEALSLAIDTQGMNGLNLGLDDYQVEQWGLKLKRLNTPQARCNVSIAYHGGYTAVPDDVVMAALLSVEAMYLRKTSNRIGISMRSKAVGSGTTEQEQYMNAWDMDVGLPKEAVAMLQSHKNFEWPSSAGMAARNY